MATERHSRRTLLRRLLIGLTMLSALSLVGLASPIRNDPQPKVVAAQTPRETEEVTLVGPQRVVVSDLPPAPSTLAWAEELRVIPRLAPELGRADGAQAPAANAVDIAAKPEPYLRAEAQLMAPSDILTSFDGLDSTDNPFDLTPPDPQLAVGPNHVVEFVNVVGRITDKSGVADGPDFSLAIFFSVPPGNSEFDPKVIYDDIHGRFFASYVSIDPATDDGFLHLAISVTNDPTGAWNAYFFGPYPDAFPDYPGIGVTNDKFTISYNLFNSVSSAFIGEQTLVVQKSDVMAGISADSFLFGATLSRFTVRPAQNLSPGDDQYLTTFDLTGGSLPLPEMTVIRITGTPDAGNVTEASAVDLPVIPQDSPPPSVTAGPGSIDSGDFRLLEAIWRNDSLWSSASAACMPPGDVAVRSCAHLIEVETVDPPSVVQDIMFGAPGEYFSWPAIRTDSSGNLFVSLTGAHAGVFASAKVAGRLASDPLGTMSGTCLLKAGEIVHETDRWGDYLGAAVDPSDPSKVWVVGEYAKDDGLVRWGTYIGSLSYTDSGICPDQPPPPPCPLDGNDGFEAGLVDTNDIPCWTVADQAGGSGSWCNQTGTLPPQGICSGSITPVAAPPELSQAAMTNQSEPGSYVLYRCGVLASGPISFQLYINNENVDFFSPPTLDYTVSPNQQFRADLVTAAGIAADVFTVVPADVLLNLYQTLPGDPPVSGYSLVAADASAFVGQEACLRFAQVGNQLSFHAGVDDVNIDLQPTPGTLWYFAEGFTGNGWETYTYLLNDGATVANVTVIYLLLGGGTVTKELSLAPETRRTLFANDPGDGPGPDQAFGVRITSDQPITAQQVLIDVPGGLAHGTAGSRVLSYTWYFAEGFTGNGWLTFISATNPGQSAADVTVIYHKTDGTSVEVTKSLGPQSRETFVGHEDVPNSAFSVEVLSTQPIVAQEVLIDTVGLLAHGTIGSTTSGTQWYLAEGYTGDFWLTFISVGNLGTQPATVTATYNLLGADPVERVIVVPAGARGTFAGHEDATGVGPGQAFGVSISSDVPIVVQQVLIDPKPGVAVAHGVMAAESLGTEFTFSGGTNEPDWLTFISVTNPGAPGATVTATYYFDSGPTVTRVQALGANQRITFASFDATGPGLAEPYAAKVSSTVPVIVQQVLIDVSPRFLASGATGTTN